MRKAFLAVLSCAALLLALGRPASATPALNFEIKAHYPSQAKISYAGGATPLVGKDIIVDSVLGIRTPLNSGETLELQNAILRFTSGDLVSYDPYTWKFGGGGSIEVIGDIPALGLTGAKLLSGVFTQANVMNLCLDQFRVAITSFIDTKDPILVKHFWGTDTPLSFYGDLQVSFNGTRATPPGSFESTQVYSGNIINNVPDASSALPLFGMGLAGLATCRRRWRRS